MTDSFGTMSASPSVVHIPLSPMTLEINATTSEYVTWVYRWKDVDLSDNLETYSPNFGHPDGWVWRMLFQQNVNAEGQRVYGVFLYVVQADNELQERTWTRDIRYLQFAVLNSEGRQLKEKSTVALFRESNLSWGFPQILDNNILARDPVASRTRKVDIVCRLRYHPKQEKMRRPLSPSLMPPGYLNGALPSNPAAQTNRKAPQQLVDSVGKSIRKLLNSRDFSDLELVVGPEQQIFYAHKAILAVRSDWFRSALRPGVFREGREGRMSLPDDDPKVFAALLEFLYSGEYPVAALESTPSLSSSKGKRPEPLHYSAASPPAIPPRTSLLADNPDSMMSTGGYADTDMDTSSGYEPSNYAQDDDDEYDDAKFALYLMADKYAITELKTLIRLHLCSEVLDSSAIRSPGQRLLRLIRFAFEELPESTRTATPTRCDSGMGSSPLTFSDRGISPPTSGYRPNPFAFGGGAAGLNGFCHDMNAERESSNVSPPAAAAGFGLGMGVERQQQNSSRTSQRSGAGDFGNGNGIYGRDNETTVLRESITGYVAKNYHAVNKIEGFDELLREGGEIGAFSKMVMETMFGQRP